MIDIWLSLSSTAQDCAIAIALFLPVAILGFLLCRGFAPIPLTAALMRRYGVTNTFYVLLIAVSVAISVGLIAQERGLRDASARTADPFDVIISAPGNEVSVMLATVFLQPSNMPLLGGETFNKIAAFPGVDLAAPLAFGDSFEGSPIVGTIAELVTNIAGDTMTGRMWLTENEAIIGSAVPLEIGDGFVPAHGVGDAADAHLHGGEPFRVVGKLAPTGTPWDGAILMPIESVWSVHGLASGHDHKRNAFEDAHADETAPLTQTLGPPFDPHHFPGTPAIVVQTNNLRAAYSVQSSFTRDLETMAFFPGAVLANLYRIMGDVRAMMSLLSLVTQVLVAVSVLLGLMILTRLFARQMAMLRALGAPIRFIIAVVWLYGSVLVGVGTLLGLVFGKLAVLGFSNLTAARTGMAITTSLGWSELHLALAFWLVTSLLALLPAWALARKPLQAALRY